jgi:hypothetical protein
VDLAAEVEAALRDFSGAPSVEVRENGGRIGVFATLSWEVRGAPQKPLLHLWSEQHNSTRRVLAITGHSEQRLSLEVERFGRARPDRLEFVRLEFARPTREASRQEVCARLGRILSEQFPDDSLESLTVSSDLEHSLSGNYARGFLRKGSTRWAVLAVVDEESAQAAENCLTFGLLWLDRAQQSARRSFVAGLRLIVPHRARRILAHHLQAIHRGISVEIYALDMQRETLERIDLGSCGNLDSWLVPHRETQSLLDCAQAAIHPLVKLAPDAITIHPLVQPREVWLRFRGLAFACWDDGNIFFGANERRQSLSSATWPALKRLVDDLEAHRRPFASDTKHQLYRLQSERWLESLVRQDVTRIDATLDPRFVYTQVFANSGGEHSILDVLTVTRNGRLAILELKAAEYIHLPVQAADYWLRVRRHLQQGDFPRYGYFTGIELQAAAPLVYLVAPALRFHPATDVLLRSLTPELEVIRVGIAEDWRSGLRVVLRQ